ncbi:hypothetical protein [Mucilaginibacter sp. KACC 22063]|uniref:hypothetical protein n=1 Tax=Mucilaginibacter sp. KACC 22063 TaxID=3025666 RepID=UPI0023653BE9|nr:hypothetical protein [Mucilaginibacter sp. KACC 22063]WDF53988.1 hypothetical protein PQ461_13655 [Mucilaginibacter sp. KACC 22063]
MRYFLFICSSFIYLASFSQVRKKTCDVLIDPEYKGAIAIYTKPLGTLIQTLKQDFKNEDYLVFTILNQTSDYFYGTLTYSISEKHINGWIRKAKYIGTYARNYGKRDKLYLYTNSDFKSSIKNTIPEWTDQLYYVTDFNNGWVYVKINYKGHIKEGWLSPDMQCSNPYTTCN